MGTNKLSIRMLKLFDKSIVKPLSVIFKNCKLKIPNVLIHKKEKKISENNYHPVSLLIGKSERFGKIAGI